MVESYFDQADALYGKHATKIFETLGFGFFLNEKTFSNWSLNFNPTVVNLHHDQVDVVDG